MRSSEENTLSGFGFGEAWENIPTYKKYIPTHLHDFVMTGWKRGPNHSTMYEDLANGYGRFVRSMLHPTVTVLNHYDAILSSLMHPRLLRMVWNNRLICDSSPIDYGCHIFAKELVKTDDLALIDQYMPLACVCDRAPWCHYNLVLIHMGPAVYQRVKLHMNARCTGSIGETGVLRLVAANSRCDAFRDLFDLFRDTVKKSPHLLNSIIDTAILSANVQALRYILETSSVPFPGLQSNSRAVFHIYNPSLLDMCKLLVEHGCIPILNEEDVRRMLRAADDLDLVSWMIDLLAKKGSPVNLQNIANTAIANNCKRVWPWLVSQGLVYTMGLANMAAIHGRMDMLEEMHKAGVDCQITIMGEIQLPIPRAFETWILRYGV